MVVSFGVFREVSPKGGVNHGCYQHTASRTLTVSVMETVGGKETVHARNFPGLKAAATDQAVYDTGSAIAGLQSLPWSASAAPARPNSPGE